MSWFDEFVDSSFSLYVVEQPVPSSSWCLSSDPRHKNTSNHCAIPSLAQHIGAIISVGLAWRSASVIVQRNIAVPFNGNVLSLLHHTSLSKGVFISIHTSLKGLFVFTRCTLVLLHVGLKMDRGLGSGFGERVFALFVALDRCRLLGGVLGAKWKCGDRRSHLFGNRRIFVCWQGFGACVAQLAVAGTLVGVSL